MVEQVDFLHQELTGLVEGYRPNGGNRWHYHCHSGGYPLMKLHKNG